MKAHESVRCMLRQETHMQWPCMGRGWPLSNTTYPTIPHVNSFSPFSVQ